MGRDEIKGYIIRHYNEMTDNQIAEKLGITYNSVRWIRRALKLKKETHLNLDCDYKRFKKGHIPKNAHPEGTITERKDNRGIPYLWIKLQGTRRMRMLNVHVWEQQNGKTPEGHCIIFKDGDTLNCNIENLECISRADLLRKNYEAARWLKNKLDENPELKKIYLLNQELKKEIKNVKSKK